MHTEKFMRIVSYIPCGSHKLQSSLTLCLRNYIIASYILKPTKCLFIPPGATCREPEQAESLLDSHLSVGISRKRAKSYPNDLSEPGSPQLPCSPTVSPAISSAMASTVIPIKEEEVSSLCICSYLPV